MLSIKKDMKIYYALGTFLILTLIVFIFTMAFMGTTINASPKELPVAIVIQDEGTTIPGKGEINLSKQIKKDLLKTEIAPLKWHVVNTKEKAIERMNNKKFYAALILPKDFTNNIVSMQNLKASDKAKAEIIINQGMNYSASTLAANAIDKILIKINSQMEEVVYQNLSKSNQSLTALQIKNLRNPIYVQKQIINKVSSNSANGNSPVLFTQTVWFTSFVASMLLFLMLRREFEKVYSFKRIFVQITAGCVSCLIIATTILVIGKYVLDINFPSTNETFLFLIFATLVFFLLQNAILNWFGLVGAPILLLLFFFSVPVLSIAPEFLSSNVHTLLYSWTPFRFAMEGFNNTFFYHSYSIKTYESTLAYVGIVSLIFILIRPTISLLLPNSKKLNQESDAIISSQ